MSDQTRRQEAIRERAREDVRMGRIPNSGYHSHTTDHSIYDEAARKAAGRN